MNDDQMIRGAISAASIPVWAWLIQKTKAHLSAARDKHGCGLPERIGRRFGKGCEIGRASCRERV